MIKRFYEKKNISERGIIWQHITDNVPTAVAEQPNRFVRYAAEKRWIPVRGMMVQRRILPLHLSLVWISRRIHYPSRQGIFRRCWRKAGIIERKHRYRLAK